MVILPGRIGTTGRFATALIEGTAVVAVGEELSEPDSSRLTHSRIMPIPVNLPVSGVAGCDLNDSSADDAVARSLVGNEWSDGVGRCCLTVATAREDEIPVQLRVISGVRGLDPVCCRRLLPPH